MKRYYKTLTILVALLSLSCVNSGELTSQESKVIKGSTSGLSILDKNTYKILRETKLDADGINIGLSAYDLIRHFAGKNPIESPDLYPENHPEVKHILEDTDNIVGHHFVFLAHRDTDRDRDKIHITDRQRNEIKAYDKSNKALKGFHNETMIYQWKFKINKHMEVSKRFSHFFQLKAKGGIDSHPILTITGNERMGKDGLEVRHTGTGKFSVLERIDWEQVTGEWIEVYCRVTYGETGSLRLIAKRISDGKTIFDIDESELDLWRGTETKHFVRPKWGIYRSILDYDNLRADEETVRFANFIVSKVLKY